MSDDLWLKSTQKRTLAMLLRIEANPSEVKEFIKLYSLEMDEEDVAYVEKKLGKTTK